MNSCNFIILGNKIAKQSDTRVLWLSAAVNYRKDEFRTELAYLQAGMKRKIENAKFLGRVVLKLKLCLFQPVKK